MIGLRLALVLKERNGVGPYMICTVTTPVLDPTEWRREKAKRLKS